MPKNNTIIHKSFSKKDLLKIVDEFNIDIGVDEKHSKTIVANTLWDVLVKMDYLHIPPNNKYLVQDLYQLRKFLKCPNPRKPLSVKDKDKYILIAKKINHYCENCYDLNESVYTDIKKIYDDAELIAKHGDIPIVRKTIKKLMKDPKKLYNIEPVLSPHIQHDIKVKQSLCKKTSFMKCEIKHGSFVLTFD
jgi:hypothetical protein|tara:strand:- start:948 stop:1520 length:573 start_codon:yes stop_codon:yes gene_type:complete